MEYADDRHMYTTHTDKDFQIMGTTMHVNLAKSPFLEIWSQFCYDLQGSCSWESMKRLLDYRTFITRRSFCNGQAPSAEVIYNNAVHT